MSHPEASSHAPCGRWLTPLSLVVVHLVACGMLYLVVVQMNWAFRDFFQQVGAQLTPRFKSVSSLADWTATSTPLVLGILVFHLIVVFRLSRRRSDWTSAYSHSTLLCMGFAAFFCISSAIDSIAWSTPALVNPPNAAAANDQNGQLIAGDIVAHPLQRSTQSPTP
jgi:hypothetical protein